MRVSVVSACYGEYDPPKPPTPQDTEHEVEFIMVTDGPVWEGWDTVVEPRPHMHNNMAAKVPKCRPDIYAHEADFLVWIDAGASFTEHLVNGLVSDQRGDIPSWTCISHVPWHHMEHEIQASRGFRKYAPLPMERQMEYYLAQGYPPDNRIWTTGISGRMNNLRNRDFGTAWMYEMVRWGFQDQLSHSYLMWRMNMNPTHLESLLPLAEFAPHIDKDF